MDFDSAFGDKWHMSAPSNKTPGSQIPPSIAAVIVAAGAGTRMQQAVPKQFLALCGKPVLCHSVDAFASHAAVTEIIIVGPADDLASVWRALGKERMEDNRLRIVAGGVTRQQSVGAGLAALSGSKAHIVGIHDAARPLVSHSMIDRLAAAISNNVKAALPVLAVTDTLKSTDSGRINGTIDRTNLWAAQTPQMFNLATIARLHKENASTQAFTDDISMIEDAGLPIASIEGDRRLMKLTHEDDLAMLGALARYGLVKRNGAMVEMMDMRVGNGFDVHRFADGPGPIMLAGISVPSKYCMLAHSDGDVGLHALCDAIFGALGDGDIGFHFPPCDSRWKNADSAQFLRYAVQRCGQHNAELRHLDLTIICETPTINPHREAMRARIAEISGLPISRIGVKATTSEGLGFTGRGEGIAAQATASLLFRSGA